MAVLYLCDGKACNEPNHCRHNGTGECRHTEKWEHALHKDSDPNEFTVRPGRHKGEFDLWEPDDGE